MSKLIAPALLLIISLFGMMSNENSSFDELWKQVAKYEKEKLPKSALEVVEQILEKGFEESNYLQSTKAALYKSKYLLNGSEFGFTNMVEFMDGHLIKTPAPYKNILHQAYAVILQQQLQSNYYVINQRISLDSKGDNEPNSWSANIFNDEIIFHYQESIKEAEKLDVDIKQFEILLSEYDDKGKLYAPKLYDVLARSALYYFSNPNSFISQPKQRFELYDAAFIGGIDDFLALSSDHPDTKSHLFQAFKFYKSHLAWNKKKSRLAPLAEANMSRLDFAYQNSTHPDKDSLYFEQLEKLEESYKLQAQYSEVLYRKAKLIHAKYQAKKYTEVIASGEDGLQQVIEWCKMGAKAFPDSPGAERCAQLYNQIFSKSIQARHEQVFLADESNLLFLQTKNIKHVELRIIALSETEWERHEFGRDRDLKNQLLRKKTLMKIQQKLVDKHPYYNLNAEIVLPELEKGFYAILLAEAGSKFKENDPVFVSRFTVSNLAFIINRSKRNKELLSVDRKHGNPLEKVEVEIYKHYYDYTDRRHHTDLLETRFSDKDGRVELNDFNDPRTSYSFRLQKGDDRVFFNRNYSLHQSDHVNHGQNQYLIFTDRAIYRPGQQVYFKVLAVYKDGAAVPTILKNHALSIQLRDNNNQIQETLELVTNDFGSCSGVFTAPQDVLKGAMRLFVNNGAYGSKQIRVEEYKRPKFYVEMEDIEGEFKLGDTIEAVVTASNFAGNKLQDAEVTYRVKREIRYPYWYYWRRYPAPVSEGQEIVNGEAKLDKQGKYSIAFEAIADRSKNYGQHAYFHYTIIADVTDINGETHSSQTSVAVSNFAFVIHLTAPAKADVSSLEELLIESKNLSGTPVSSNGTYSIYKLEEPASLYKKRYWAHPDSIFRDESAFYKKTDAYSYEDERNFGDWKVSKTMITDDYNYSHDGGEQNNAINLSKAFKAGVYKIEINSTDKYGNEISNESFIELTDFANSDFALTSHLHHKLDKTSYEPGDNALLSLGSPDDKLKIYYQVDSQLEMPVANWTSVEDATEISIPIKNSDRGGKQIRLMYVQDNRYYEERISIEVPWSNKVLNIKFESFRDKMLPGAQEEFKIKISSPDGKAQAAEMLAAMYDASLDQFVKHEWKSNTSYLFPNFNSYYRADAEAFQAMSLRSHNYLSPDYSLSHKNKYFLFPNLDFGILYGHTYRDNMRGSRAVAVSYSVDGVMMKSRSMEEVSVTAMSAAPAGVMAEEMDMDNGDKKDANIQTEVLEEGVNGPVDIRQNLNETTFFYPNLETDDEGNISISFTAGEALTKWKLLSFVHDKSLRFAHDEQELVTSKDLMVFPNMPRFLRDGDNMFLQAKVANVSEENISGIARIELVDAITGKVVNALFGIDGERLPLEIPAGESKVYKWRIDVPQRKIDAVLVRIIADGGKHVDGEENMLPVLTDRMLVTETRSIIVDPETTKRIRFESLSSSQSSSLVHKKFALEYTPNPAWYAIQALPYLMEYPYECTEQVLNRYYANSLAQNIANSHPRIKQVFDAWAHMDADALLSNLEKNQDLKSALLKETPWLLDAKNESANKRRIANLFELNKMASERKSALKILQRRQLYDGGFAWFEGGRANRYISQYVMEGLGHLIKLGVLKGAEYNEIRNLIQQGVAYLDLELKKEYDQLKRFKADLDKDHLSHIALHYLYVRGFFTDFDQAAGTKDAYKYFLKQAKTYGNDKGIYGAAMASISLLRLGEEEASLKIRKSLIERSLRNDELGVYWNEGTGYHWYELPIERHALMIELMAESNGDQGLIDDLKKWLLLNKQTNNWKTTKGTASAIYALLIAGESDMGDWISEASDTEIFISGKSIDLTTGAELATGYIRKDWSATEINDDFAEITVKNNSNHLGWGGVYWQYFEEMDKVKQFKETPLTMDKKIYRVGLDAQGETMEEITDQELNIGDKLMVRIELEVDRSMEYVHLKDMRAAGLEPLSTNSGYKWGSGLFYYESPGDLATDFFIDYLPKGKYVFEYPLRASQIGVFSNGIATIQNMYAPEYSSHSEGIEVKITE